MISKEAQDFWTLLKTYPKQIEMPLAQAREADTHAEDFTAEPAAVTFPTAADVDGFWAETRDAQPGRAILYLFGGGFAVGSPATRRKTAGHLALAAKARMLVPNYRLAPEYPFPAALDDAVRAYEWLLAHGPNHRRLWLPAIPLAAVLPFQPSLPCAIVACRCPRGLWRFRPGSTSPAAARA